jgi:predicted transcriptional regulator
MKNLQISLDDAIVSYLDRIASQQHKTRIAVIRDALLYWVKQSAVERFEEDWIAALKSSNRSEYSDNAELWMAAEAWDEE